MFLELLEFVGFLELIESSEFVEFVWAPGLFTSGQGVCYAYISLPLGVGTSRPHDLAVSIHSPMTL